MAIGNNNGLLCHLSGDLKRFKALTTGHPVIMGRKTFESLPRRPLPNRRNIVLTSSTVVPCEGVEVANSVDEVLSLIPADTEAFVIGGATLYEQFLPYVGKLYVTWIYRSFEADTFFPTIDPSLFRQTAISDLQRDPANGIAYAYADYVRCGA